MFLDINLPTMLAAGNLPALTTGIDCEYLIYTTTLDATLLERNGAFARLRSLMPVEVKLFAPEKTKHPIELHQEIWQRATEHARSRGAFILLMPPDVGWADGSFASLRAALIAGKRAIFMTYPRVVCETIVPALREQSRANADGSLTIPPNSLMALAITHIHPLIAAYNRRTNHFAIHPEMVVWPIEGDGFLLRLLARELFCFEPGSYPLNAQALLAHMPREEDIHVFSDSCEFLGISLTPLWKDMEWYLANKRLDPLFIGRWWNTYDSPVNDYLSKINLRFHCRNGSEVTWRRAELSADMLFAHLRSAREFTRILMALVQMGHARAATFLASALRIHGIARRWPHRGPWIVLAPTDEAFERAGFARIPGDGMTAVETRRLLEAHVAPISTSTNFEEGCTVTTLNGNTLTPTNTARSKQCGDNIILPVEEFANTLTVPSNENFH